MCGLRDVWSATFVEVTELTNYGSVIEALIELFWFWMSVKYARRCHLCFLSFPSLFLRFRSSSTCCMRWGWHILIVLFLNWFIFIPRKSWMSPSFVSFMPVPLIYSMVRRSCLWLGMLVWSRRCIGNISCHICRIYIRQSHWEQIPFSLTRWLNICSTLVLPVSVHIHSPWIW